MDIQQMVREMRERALAQVTGNPVAAGPSPAAAAGAASLDVGRLREAARRVRLAESLVGQPPPQPPGLRGRIGALLVKVVRRMLFWYTPQIAQFHHAAAEAADEQASFLTAVARDSRHAVELAVSLSRRLETIQAHLSEFKGQMHPASLDSFYVAFEDIFRGTCADIKSRLEVYLPILKEAGVGGADMPALDLGCGRGEWLELLAGNGMNVQGVDSNSVMAARCRSRGLPVIHADVMAYLKSLPPSSLGLVTAFHLLEHLPFLQLIGVLDETVRVLKPGGLAIFETPNPGNVLVGSSTFYLDPTHHNPLPSSLLRFAAEARGLSRVEVLNLHPYPEDYRIAEDERGLVQRVNELFYGPQDYAIIGRKL